MMLDARLGKLIAPILQPLAGRLVQWHVSANQITISGFLIGMLALPLLGFQQYQWALLAILLNRMMDGLDGAVARQTGVSDSGGYLDIVLDFIFYSAVVFGFAIADPTQAIYAAFLIFSFVGTGTSFLAFAIFAAKHNFPAEVHLPKSIHYLGGLTEGTETILLFTLICVFPASFTAAALVFGIMCWITTASRIYYAVEKLQRSDMSGK